MAQLPKSLSPRPSAGATHSAPIRSPGMSRQLAVALSISLSAWLAGCAVGPHTVSDSGSAAGSSPHPATSPTSPTTAATATNTPNSANAANLDTATAHRFDDWIASFGRSARAAGIDDATIQSALGQAHFVPSIIGLDRAQPEFNRPVWSYLDSALSANRIARGREKLQQLREPLTPIVAPYGVPLEILFAFWGVESDFGRNVGDIPVIDALATLGFDGRREAWARDELLAALRILQRKDIDAQQLVGSWAGAMGQTQFMPTVFLNYAVDADGNGQRDIWNSIPDVMASTANFVAHAGWQRGQAWIVELKLPPQFDYANARPDLQRPASAWAADGVQSMNGAALPDWPDSAILLPAGLRGPAFLVGANFRTLLQYNNATSYALAVGLLAQQLGGAPPVQAAWPRDLQALSRAQVQTLQTTLNLLGFDCGTADGIAGPATQRAIRQYQQKQGLPADGYPTVDLLNTLTAQTAKSD